MLNGSKTTTDRLLNHSKPREFYLPCISSGNRLATNNIVPLFLIAANELSPENEKNQVKMLFYSFHVKCPVLSAISISSRLLPLEKINKFLF